MAQHFFLIVCDITNQKSTKIYIFCQIRDFDFPLSRQDAYYQFYKNAPLCFHYDDHLLFIEHLRNINLLHTLVNSHTLSLDTIKAVIAQMRRTFIKLHTTFHMSESLKLHIIFSHYVEYFELTGHTLLKYTDEVTEAVHSQLRMFEERHKYKRNIKESTGHAIAQHNCTVFFNSVALGDL